MDSFLLGANYDDSGKCAKRTTHQREELKHAFNKNVTTVAEKTQLPVPQSTCVVVGKSLSCLPIPAFDSCRLVDLYTYCCSRPQKLLLTSVGTAENTPSVPDRSVYQVSIYKHNLQLFSYLIRVFYTQYPSYLHDIFLLLFL